MKRLNDAIKRQDNNDYKKKVNEKSSIAGIGMGDKVARTLSMQWFKVMTNDIGHDYKSLSDAEFRILFKLRWLTAQLERVPRIEEIKPLGQWKAVNSLVEKANLMAIAAKFTPRLLPLQYQIKVEEVPIGVQYMVKEVLMGLQRASNRRKKDSESE